MNLEQGKNQNILIVDDDPVIREIIETIVNALG